MNASILEKLFSEHFNEDVVATESMPEHASSRRLVRLIGKTHACIGVFYQDLAENRAFISFARVFFALGLRVPEVFVVSDCEQYYLISDLGKQTLFDLVLAKRNGDRTFPESVTTLYKKSLSALVQFQVRGAKAIDYSLCYQGDVYGGTAMRNDFAAFEKDYLQRIGVQYNAVKFQEDCDRFIAFLLQSKADYFMFRDFQARNIVINEGTPGFVDFQAGRRGPLQYDVVSLLFQSQAQIPVAVREELLEHYLDELGRVQEVNQSSFRELFYGYVLMRLYQVLATYGREGLGKKKGYFLNGIPMALQLLQEIVDNKGFPVHMTELATVTNAIIRKENHGQC